MSKENSDFQLYDSIISVHEITCSNCSFKDSVDVWCVGEACEIFYKDGWRVPRSKCYCPKCAKKKLKTK